MVLLGFSSGLPLLLVYGTLSFRLREAGVDLATIGFLSWVALAYGFKWAWAPLVDRMPIPWLSRRLGRRRAWLLSAQLAVVAGLVAMALIDPQLHLAWLTASALLTAFASATQDIALDAYRIESAPVDHQAALAAAYQTGYRLAMIWAGAGALWIAALASGGDADYRHDSWSAAYLAMAASMAIGLAATVLAPEADAGPAPSSAPSSSARHGLAAWLSSAVIGPFADFLQRYRWHAVLVLALISTYRIPDIVMGVMANPFYHDMGFSKDEVAAVSKVYGVVMTLAGAFAGGALAPRIGIQRVLFGAAAAASASIMMFAWLATRGHDLPLLVAAVSADNFVAGVAGSVFIAYLSGLTNVRYSATQYALFSSLMLLLPKFVAGFSGVAVERFGYSGFFVGAALLGLPVLLLVWLTGRYGMPAR
jgi:PAT family beta-lactamase induction signal transducer AmpG